MEQRKPSFIWAGVFGRGNLRFVFNEAGAKNLTNFHCLYLRKHDPLFARALVAVLSSTRVREGMRDHQRSFGGGLSKFEPNDLKLIPVPNLIQLGNELLMELAAGLDDGDKAVRSCRSSTVARIDALVDLL